jgi:hypothetical protein
MESRASIGIARLEWANAPASRSRAFSLRQTAPRMQAQQSQLRPRFFINFWRYECLVDAMCEDNCSSAPSIV